MYRIWQISDNGLRFYRFSIGDENAQIVTLCEECAADLRGALSVVKREPSDAELRTELYRLQLEAAKGSIYTPPPVLIRIDELKRILRARGVAFAE